MCVQARLHVRAHTHNHDRAMLCILSKGGVTLQTSSCRMCSEQQPLVPVASSTVGVGLQKRKKRQVCIRCFVADDAKGHCRGVHLCFVCPVRKLRQEPRPQPMTHLTSPLASTTARPPTTRTPTPLPLTSPSTVCVTICECAGFLWH